MIASAYVFSAGRQVEMAALLRAALDRGFLQAMRMNQSYPDALVSFT